MVRKRVNHYLTPNHATFKPTRHLFFDTETSQVVIDERRTEQRLKLGWAMYWRKRPDNGKDTIQWKYFETVPEFWSFVLSKLNPTETLYISSHNLNFDFSVLQGFDYLADQGWEMTGAYNKGSTSIIRLAHGEQQLIAVDNQNWWKCSLKALGKLLDLDKGDVDPLTASKEELIPYCKRDVEIIYQAWRAWYAFMDEHDLGKWSFTLPGQAFAAFRHRFMETKLLVHADVEALTMERESYKGGRASVFYKGDFSGQTFYKLDINSAYPWAMKNFPVPVALLNVYRNPDQETVRRWCQDYCVVARVSLSVDDNPFPVGFQNHNVYPIGDFDTTLTTPELVLAQERGWVQAIHEVCLYRKAQIFDKYVDYFYSLKARYKDEDNQVYFRLAKLMLNGNYGKWGQMATHFEFWQELTPEFDGVDFMIDLAQNKRFKLYRFGRKLYREISDGESDNSIPSIAAHVTAQVRLYLYRLMTMAGRDNVYVCDTDSLIVTEPGYNNLASMLHETELGKLKCEGTSTDFISLAPKNYCFEQHWTRKAIPPKAEEIETDTWQFTKFPTIRGLAGVQSGVPYYTEITTRHLNYTIYDGTVTPSGRIVPLNARVLQVEKKEPTPRDFEIMALDDELDALRASRTVDPQIVFKLWDFRVGDWKRVRNFKGLLEPVWQAEGDEIATQEGFPDLASLQDAIRNQIKTDEQIRAVAEKRKALVYDRTVDKAQDRIFL